MGRYGRWAYLAAPKSAIGKRRLRPRTGGDERLCRSANQPTLRRPAAAPFYRSRARSKCRYFFARRTFCRSRFRHRKSDHGILRKAEETGKTILIVHHDLPSVEEYFDWACFLNNAASRLWPRKRGLHMRKIWPEPLAKANSFSTRRPISPQRASAELYDLIFHRSGFASSYLGMHFDVPRVFVDGSPDFFAQTISTQRISSHATYPGACLGVALFASFSPSYEEWTFLASWAALLSRRFWASKR